MSIPRRVSGKVKDRRGSKNFFHFYADSVRLFDFRMVSWNTAAVVVKSVGLPCSAAKPPTAATP